MKYFTCPGCGFPTLSSRGNYQICSVCNWEDDNQDDKSEDEIWGGPNSTLSLTENRLNIGNILKYLEDSLNGKINDNPKDVISILTNHDNKIKTIIENIPETDIVSDTILTEYTQQSESVLYDLIKRK
ncbi:MAG: hypothetical protein K9I36_16210 [Bacteroidia bacterium]|nr:hypothetical protein [Bacteroidia bacterium]MCF8428281.1 hypothetical protein [Bacteroidia bacterium]